MDCHHYFFIIITPRKVLQRRLLCRIVHFARLFWVCVCVSGHSDLECSALVLPLQQTCTQYSFWYQLSYIPNTCIHTLSSPNSKDLFNMQGLLICRFHLRSGGNPYNLKQFCFWLLIQHDTIISSYLFLHLLRGTQIFDIAGREPKAAHWVSFFGQNICKSVLPKYLTKYGLLA